MGHDGQDQVLSAVDVEFIHGEVCLVSVDINQDEAADPKTQRRLHGHVRRLWEDIEYGRCDRTVPRFLDLFSANSER